MKYYVRNRHKEHGNPGLFFPYQAVLWFKCEPVSLAYGLAARYVRYLVDELNMSHGALGKVHGGLVSNQDNTSVGIIFSHRKYADEARDSLGDWLINLGE